MNKKFFIIGLTALLGVSLFLAGCPTDSDDDGLSQAEKDARALKDALVGAAVDGTTVTLTESMTVPDGTTVPPGVTLVVPGGVTLTVAADTTLNVAAGAVVNIEATGIIAVVGTYQLGAGVTGTNTGTINIRGTSHADAATNLPGDGSNIVHEGGKASFDGGTSYFVGSDGDDAQFELTDGTFSFNNAGFVLNGDATLHGANKFSDGQMHFAIVDSLTLTIESGTLTIPSPEASDKYTMLWVNAVDGNTTPRILGGAGAEIALGTRGHIYFKENDVDVSSFGGDKTWNNFYSDTNNKITAGLWNGNETYVWTTTLGDGDDEGWLKQ